jgi:FdhE protein
MGQLVGKDPGRLWMLSCGCCGTRWRYRRTGCPFCERTDDHWLSVVGVEGESVLLADWTSLHLDLLARDRGLKRMAGSLYEI